MTRTTGWDPVTGEHELCEIAQVTDIVYRCRYPEPERAFAPLFEFAMKKDAQWRGFWKPYNMFKIYNNTCQTTGLQRGKLEF
jgi:hypothetical protein